MAEHRIINPTIVEQSEVTKEATIESIASTNSESSVKIPQFSKTASVDENSLEYSNELMKKGNDALKEGDFPEASEFFSRALEIRVANYGELAPKCVNSYYKYGLALLSKAQEETDPLGTMPKKDAKSQQGSVKLDNVERTSSVASVSSNVVRCSSSIQQQGTKNVCTKSEEDKVDESDTEERGEEEEDESDLDLAWKMLDLARAISEKHSKETMDMVDILSALAEVSLEREDIETSLSDYQKALIILECLVESDSRHIAELYPFHFLHLKSEVGSKAEDAIPYCQKAISVCKSRIQRLMDKTTSPCASTTTSETVGDGVHSSVSSKSETLIQWEIETLTSLSSDLEKKASFLLLPCFYLSLPTTCCSFWFVFRQFRSYQLEDLQQLVSDILGLVAAKARISEQASASGSTSSSRLGTVANNGDFDSPTVSTAHTSSGTPEVKHLGVVGRGVKRPVMSSPGVEPSSIKRPALDRKPDGNADVRLAS
ncbi:hypothetical protein KSS87_017612 [Heliosperma pusillum]|nr:hypothetical protein KSS87_017612 [Heliosperma pusillum]